MFLLGVLDDGFLLSTSLKDLKIFSNIRNLERVH